MAGNRLNIFQKSISFGNKQIIHFKETLQKYLLINPLCFTYIFVQPLPLRPSQERKVHCTSSDLHTIKNKGNTKAISTVVYFLIMHRQF